MISQEYPVAEIRNSGLQAIALTLVKDNSLKTQKYF